MKPYVSLAFLIFWGLRTGPERPGLRAPVERARDRQADGGPRVGRIRRLWVRRRRFDGGPERRLLGPLVLLRQRLRLFVAPRAAAAADAQQLPAAHRSRYAEESGTKVSFSVLKSTFWGVFGA